MLKDADGNEIKTNFSINDLVFGQIDDISHFSVKNNISGGGSLLLDLYPNSLLALSLRKLSSSFSGNVIRVRRSSDNQEQDIPFDGDAIDTANLLTFVGANDGFIVKWFDQSGNSNDAYQNTASRQTQIVTSGVVETDNTNNLPTSVWSSSQYVLTNNISTTLEYYNIVKIRRPNRNTNFITTLGSSTTFPRILSWATNGSGNARIASMNGQVSFGSSTALGGFILETYRQTDGEMFLFTNNNQSGATPNTTSVGATLTRFGSRGSTLTTGEYQELVYWGDNSFNNRAEIYTNLNDYYQ